MSIMNLIEDKVIMHYRKFGYKPTHITMSIDIFTKMKAELDPIMGYYIPSEYTSDLKPDTVRGLVIGITSNHNTIDYLEVT